MTGEAPLNCWRCGTALDWLTLPVARNDACRACRAEVHACRMCRFYDPRKAKSCAEPVADEVHDKERANFCGYFEPSRQAFSPQSGSGAAARDALEALFGPKK